MIAETEMQLTRETGVLIALGKELTRSRKLTAESLSRSILVHLKDLGFSQAAFDILFHALDEPRGTGFETVEFLFAANAGEPLKPMRAVASSGEISRLMLAVKAVLAKQDLVGLLVFDEIDANVGALCRQNRGDQQFQGIVVMEGAVSIGIKLSQSAGNASGPAAQCIFMLHERAW